MKRILFLSTLEWTPWGGCEELWSRTAERLKGKGPQVGVCFGSKSEFSERFPDFSKSGDPFVKRRDAQQKRSGWLRKLGKVRHVFDEFQPDLVVISAENNSSGLSWMQACLERKIPYVIILHTFLPSSWLAPGRIREYRRFLEAALRCYFVSEANRGDICFQYGIDKDRTKVISNPFSVNYDGILPWPDESAGYKLACVGRLSPPDKAQDVLFRVLSMPKWRERDLTVSLYGISDYLGYFEFLKTKYELKNIRLAGFENDMEALWRGHHGLILPSRYEGMPITIIEAMLCGRPCIVTDVGGNTEFVSDNENGFVAPAPRAHYLDEAMERAWQNRSRWQNMGVRAAERARALISPDPAGAFADEILSLKRD